MDGRDHRTDRRLRAAVRRALRRTGWDVRGLGARARVVRHSTSRHRVVPIGGDALRATLVWDRRRVRARPARLQQRLAQVAQRELVMWVLRAGEVDCVVDAGANTGQFAQGLRRAGYRGRIVSFDPVRSAYDGLAAAARDDDAWWVRHCGLGSSDGTATIHAMRGTMSSLLPPSDFGREWAAGLRNMTSEEVTIRRLDGLMPEILDGLDAGRVYLKMDTQGYDLEVVQGAGEALDRVVALQAELSCVPIYDGMTRLPEQWVALEAAGFESAGVFPVSFDHETVRAIEYDVVMVRAREMRGL
jgi:FkbM family methyltransferase